MLSNVNRGDYFHVSQIVLASLHLCILSIYNIHRSIRKRDIYAECPSVMACVTSIDLDVYTTPSIRFPG